MLFFGHWKFFQKRKLLLLGACVTRDHVSTLYRYFKLIKLAQYIVNAYLILDKGKHVKTPKRSSILAQPEILTDICRSILISATANQSLRMLELQNLPLTCDDITLLCQVGF